MSRRRTSPAPASVRPSVPTPSAGIDYAFDGARRTGDRVSVVAILLMAVVVAGLGALAWRALARG